MTASQIGLFILGFVIGTVLMKIIFAWWRDEL